MLEGGLKCPNFEFTYFIDVCMCMFAGKKVMSPLSWFNVTRRKKYRFRVIGTGSLYPLRVSVDNHEILVVATDGYDIDPWMVESLVIQPGERYDFILDANQPYGNYWIRGVSLEASTLDLLLRIST